MEKNNFSDIFFSLSSIDGRKQRRRPETFPPRVGIMPSQRARQENWFYRFKEDRFDISDTPRSGRLSVFDEDRLNTLIHNDPRQCTRELANVMNCDHSTIVQHLYSIGKVKKSGVCVCVCVCARVCTACSKPKPQKLAGGSSSIGS